MYLKKLSEIFQNLKSQKFALALLLVILLVFFLAIAAFADDFTRDSLVQNPNVANRTNGQLTDSTPLNLRVISPPSGVRSVLDTLEIITFEFDAPIDYKSFDYRSSPPILLSVIEDAEHPNVLILVPESDGWIPNTEYTITITALKGLGNSALVQPITYTYLNNPPDTMQMPFPY